MVTRSSRSWSWRRCADWQSERSSPSSRVRPWLTLLRVSDSPSSLTPRQTGRPYGWEDVVALLGDGPGEQAAVPPDSRYLAASLMLELGIYVAAADGTVEDGEVDQVARFIESQFMLGPPAVRRLEALERVFAMRRPTLAGLGKRLQATLTQQEREAIGRCLTGIVTAGGITDRKEVSALKSAYRALDIGAVELNLLLQDSRRGSVDPVELDAVQPVQRAAR